MGTKLEQIQLLLQQRIARKRGPTSSDQFNDTIEEISQDSTELNTQWNNRLVPLTTTLPDGSDDTDIDAFNNGLDGSSMYVDADIESGTYYNTTANRPNTVKEQLVNVYTTISDLETDLQDEINDTSTTASQIAVTDTPGLYSGEDVEACLTEVMQEVNGLALTNYELTDLTDVDTTGVVSANCLVYNGTQWIPSGVISGGVATTGQIYAIDGNAAAPGISFVNEKDIGFTRPGNNRLGFVTSGTQYWDLDGDGWLTNSVGTRGIATPDGTEDNPTWSFYSDPDTGMYLSGTNIIGITTSGLEKWTIGNDGNMVAQQAGMGLEVDNITVGNQATGLLSIDAHMSQAIQPTLTPTGTTQTINWDNGNLAVLDLESATGDVTLTLSNPDVGAFYLIKIIQDSAVARDVNWPASVLWDDGVTPVITAANDAIDIVTLWYDGTYYHATISQNKS